MSKDGYVYVDMGKVVYGLPQAGILSQQLLEKRLNKKGFRQSRLTPGLWQYEWHPVTFILYIADFGVKYTGKSITITA